MWCIQQITPEYRERMYRLLNLYKQSYDPLYPVICIDEKSKQLLEDSRKPIPAKPGSPEKYDYEYKRKGTCNIFLAVDPKGGFRYVKVTDTRGKAAFASFIKDLVNLYAKAKYIRIVLDNLNTHFIKSLVETFGKREANKLMKRIQFIYTPKHASWLNMAEIEINIMDRQCTGVRITTQKELRSKVAKWAKSRNKKKCTIDWKFTRQDADKKLSKHYVS
jgi:hypothetical protein